MARQNLRWCSGLSQLLSCVSVAELCLTISSSVLTGLDCQLKPTMLSAVISISARTPGMLLLPGNQEK